MTRLARALAAALLAVAVLAACARIPLAGPVLEGQDVEQSENQGYLLLPDPPVPGAGQDEIVRGFLDAGTGTQSNYEVAREFLSNELASTWDPTARVLVHAGPVSIARVDETTVTATIDVVAQVGPNGRYQELASPERRVLTYRLQSVGNEWRISSAEHGLVLLRETFSQVFKPFTLQFFDQSMRRLVPDVRWFPDHPTAPTRIVQGLLAGPVEWLREGGVGTAFPADTVLRGPVTADAGIAAADFSPGISSASSENFSLMFLQLRESLIGVSGITDLRMSVNGAQLDVSLPGDGVVQTQVPVNATPVVARGSDLGYLSGDSITPPKGAESLGQAAAALRPWRGTVSVTHQLGAFLTPRGVVALPFSGGPGVLTDGRLDLAAPSIDPQGYVWTASASSAKIGVMSGVGGARTELEIPGVGRQGVVSLQVSREGARLAALVKDGGALRVVVAAVLRDTAGVPVGIGVPEVIPLGSGTPRELTWVDATSFAVLVADASGSTVVRTHLAGGATADYGAVQNATQIAGGNTLAGLRIVDAAGSMWVPRNNRWQATGAAVQYLATQA